MNKNLSQLQKTINFFFKNLNYLCQALTHKSYANENLPLKIPHNEKMEFLGDAILEMVISEYLINRFPSLNEGELTQLRSVLVSKSVLFKRAQKIRLHQVLLLGRGEIISGGRRRKSTLANAFEALICAIYLDQGLPAVKKFIISQMEEEIQQLEKEKYGQDFKSTLQRLSQIKFGQIPEYRIVREKGPPHQKIFTVEVKVENKTARGAGKSKKEAEQKAAANILENLKKLD
jgi:ribonuclease-3